MYCKIELNKVIAIYLFIYYVSCIFPTCACHLIFVFENLNFYSCRPIRKKKKHMHTFYLFKASRVNVINVMVMSFSTSNRLLRS